MSRLPLVSARSSGSTLRSLALVSAAALVLGFGTASVSAQIIPGPVLPPGIIVPPILPPIFPPIEPIPGIFGPQFERGDVNDDTRVDISDASALLSFLFLGGDEPHCMKAADVDDSGVVTVGDAVNLLGFLFRGTEPPRAPFGRCGGDPTADSLSCRISTRCGTAPSCPDPAIVDLRVEVVRRDNRFEGRIRITAVLENLGALYDSGRNQQSLLLSSGFGSSFSVVRNRAFEDLATGARVEVSHEVEWYTGNEFPPSFRASISYDPDITIDGNPRNDDCNSTNNRLEITGYEIHEIFRGA